MDIDLYGYFQCIWTLYSWTLPKILLSERAYHFFCIYCRLILSHYYYWNANTRNTTKISKNVIAKV